MAVQDKRSSSWWSAPTTAGSTTSLASGGVGSTASQQAAQEYVAAQIRAEYERAYQMASLDAQLRMHAAEIAEEAARRKLDEMIALGWINGSPTLAWSEITGYYNPTGGPVTSTTQLAPTLARQQAEGELGLQYLQYLESLRKNPRDWISYANALRDASGTALPQYAANLASWLNQPVAAEQTGQSLQGNAATGANAPTTMTSLSAASNLPWMQYVGAPQKATAKTWNELYPTEKEMLQGAVEASGQYWDDWYNRMQRYQPKASVTGISWWS